MNKQIAVLFKESITEQGIKDIIAKHDPAVVRDMTNEVEFKEARKVRTEMNKLLDVIDRIGIDKAGEVTAMRDDLKARVESAYSPTVTPFLIENQARKDEVKRLELEKKKRNAEQEQKIADIKGASNRAMHLPIDDLEDILQEVMATDLLWFDDEHRGGAQIAKEVSISKLKDAFKYLSEKEDARKATEIKDAELADKDDEITKLKAQLAELQPNVYTSQPAEHRPVVEHVVQQTVSVSQLQKNANAIKTQATHTPMEPELILWKRKHSISSDAFYELESIVQKLFR